MPESPTKPLSYEDLRSAVAGNAAAFRCVTRLQPAGGPGDKVFPPTYEGGKYATEKRRINGEVVDCVLLDSVQSQANRMELALLDAWERGQIPLPVISVDFAGAGLPEIGRITSLEAPHRIADAILRDSLLNGVPFRKSDDGKRVADVSSKNATALFELCPTALVFGMWDSTGPRGGLGAKFARALVSEMVGNHAQMGCKTSSRIDPLQILVQAGPLYKAKDGGWTLGEEDAIQEKKAAVKFGKEGKPSEANHGNVTPSIEDGGCTISEAIQTTVLSLAALRRLRFPVNGKSDPAMDDAARLVLASLGLCAATLARDAGCDLRSRCLLHPTEKTAWELLDGPGEPKTKFVLSSKDAAALVAEAVSAAKKVGLPWREDGLSLVPSPQLVALVRRSVELAAQTSADNGED